MLNIEYYIFNPKGGVRPEEFDAFHELILQDELCRTGSYVSANGWSAGLSIGLPPVLFFGSKELKDKVGFLLRVTYTFQVAGPCLRGEKIICLAITEPAAGSDVAKITTEAKLSPCGKYVFYLLSLFTTEHINHIPQGFTS